MFLLLSGYFVIAGLYYHFVSPPVIQNVKADSTEKEKALIDKYGPLMLLFFSLIWPVMTVLSILYIIAVLLKR